MRISFGRFPAGKRGSALIFVVGMIALLSILSTVFARLSQLERATGRNYVEQVRARLAAESGIEFAVGRLQALPAGPVPAELAADVAKPVWGELTAPPSFATNTNGNAATSGAVGGTHAPFGDRFRVWVRDTSGQLNINDTDSLWNIDNDPYEDYPMTASTPNAQDALNAPGRLRQLIATLAEAKFGDPVAPTGIGDSVADAIVQARAALPGGRFLEMREVSAALEPLILNGELDEARRDALLEDLTLWSWQARDVLRPRFQLAVSGVTPATPAGSRHDVRVFRDFQCNGYELDARCPVNVNTASEDLLTALIAPVHGWFLREGPAERVTDSRYGIYVNAPLGYGPGDANAAGGYAADSDRQAVATSGSPLRFGKNNMLGRAMLSPRVRDPRGLAQAVWNRVHDAANPRPFRTWEEWESFLRVEVDPDLIVDPAALQGMFDDAFEGRNPGDEYSLSFNAPFAMLPPRERWWADYVRRAQIDALLANFNPNAMLNDFTPDRTTYRRVDKAHLAGYTTELCFEPTGVFAIAGQGEIAAADGVVLARAEIRSIFRVFETLRQTTQRQFMRGVDQGDPASQSLVFQSPVSFIGAGAAAGESGFLLQSYPEPLYRAGEAVIMPPLNGFAAVPTSGAPGSQFPDISLNASGMGGLAAIAGGFPGAPEPEGPTILYLNTVTPPTPLTLPAIVLNAAQPFSRVDGAIRLATLRDSLRGHAMPAKFLHGFDGRLVALEQEYDASHGNGMYLTGGEHLPLAARNWPTEARLTPEWLASPLPGKKVFPGNLYPDGGYSEIGRVLTIPMGNIGSSRRQTAQANGSLTGSQGAVAFWVKPNFDPGVASQPASLLRFFARRSAGGWTFQPQAFPFLSEMSLYYFAHDLPTPDNVNQVFGAYAVRGMPNWLNATNEWIAPRSFQFGWGGLRPSLTIPPYNTTQPLAEYFQNVHGRSSATAVENAPPQDDAALDVPKDQVRHFFEGRCWNHILVSWHLQPPAPPAQYDPTHPQYIDTAWPGQIRPMQEKSLLAVNGVISEDVNGGYDEGEYPFDVRGQGGINTFLRLGEVMGGGEEFGKRGVYNANCVYDELLAYEDFFAYDDLMNEAGQAMVRGRYANREESRAFFTAVAVPLRTELELPRCGSLRLRSVSWTAYWPQGQRDPSNWRIDPAMFPAMNVATDPGYPSNTAGDPGSVLSDMDLLSVDVGITRSGGPTRWLFLDAEGGDLGAAKQHMPANPGGSDPAMLLETFYGMDAAPELTLGPDDAFQYRVYFNFEEASDKPFHDSPVFDDITFTFVAARPAVLYWSER